MRGYRRMEAFNKPIVFVIEDLVGLHDLARTKITIFLHELK